MWKFHRWVCSVNGYRVQIYIITGFENKSGHVVSVVVLDYVVLRAVNSSLILWQPLVTNTNSIQEVNLLVKYCCRDYKRTWQEVSDVLLSYLYYRYMVYACHKLHLACNSTTSRPIFTN